MKLVEIPTDFDDFSQKAHSNYNDLSENILNNREILRKIMEKNRFIQNEFEWWHFDYKSLLDSPIIEFENRS